MQRALKAHEQRTKEEMKRVLDTYRERAREEIQAERNTHAQQLQQQRRQLEVCVRRHVPPHLRHVGASVTGAKKLFASRGGCGADVCADRYA